MGSELFNSGYVPEFSGTAFKVQLIPKNLGVLISHIREITSSGNPYLQDVSSFGLIGSLLSLSSAHVRECFG